MAFPDPDRQGDDEASQWEKGLAVAVTLLALLWFGSLAVPLYHWLFPD